jgi:hypothetical protein
MMLVEAFTDGRTTVTGSSESHSFLRKGSIGLLVIISTDQPRNVHQDIPGSRLAGESM